MRKGPDEIVEKVVSSERLLHQYPTSTADPLRTLGVWKSGRSKFQSGLIAFELLGYLVRLVQAIRADHLRLILLVLVTHSVLPFLGDCKAITRPENSRN